MPVPKNVWKSIQADMRAVTALTKNQCDIHALAAMFSSVDKMAWLSSSNIDHGGKEFKKWVDDYFLVNTNFALNAEDLWAARCGLLHAGSAESKLYRHGKAKQIFYAVGQRRSDAEVKAELDSKLPQIGLTADEVVAVHCMDLFDLWIASAERFTNAIESDPALEARTEMRAAKQLAIFPF
ncbi:hypothetical protein Q1W70_01615 [Pseudomonas kielensis]|uniref:hypothetical protein n=1 Tax=Pseudomonas kielensis TaxID=2762577 RepID=UPI00265E3306|nr:hypothetical protein [Pseudomonas kielensis]WKL53312.1 hypothetical protein Q1W70_01615 [Pseudomonas kielensis]